MAAASSTPFPFAAAPDVIRTHQKDAYFTGSLSNDLTTLHRSLLGARSAHSWAPESRLAASLLYLSLTTLVGNRTLGEEYTDVVQVDAPRGKLPSLARRTSYILASVLAPYFAGRLVPKLRSKLRAALEARIKTLSEKGKTRGKEARIWRYFHEHLPSITSPVPFHALSLAIFYFSGTYYELAKRLVGLRYIFTHKVPDTPDRGGYEVLGALLTVQLATQAYLHARSLLSPTAEETQGERLPDAYPAEVHVSMSDNAYATNNGLLAPTAAPAQQTGTLNLEKTTHTPVLAQPRHDLADDAVLAYIRGGQQRKCTLCLEALRDPAATQCGHVFCWACIGDWVREKPECPLCRREAMVQHILPLRIV